ncbi:phosphatase PAP2 family protein [Georgenia sp. SYP-B2076]|uniref:phosphatase PAP2 family protein n=1 Tax=Georgenia sp. SYP-B2076 TaxID=2495881 RepID=UPI000F8E25C5|nr:phosphatase PAP2 family protein [Georgenia sp. SYP-B2076]
MTETLLVHAPRSDLARRAGGLVLAALAAAAVVAVWWFFVTTHTGRSLDDVAYVGSRIGRGRLSDYAQAVLDVVSVPLLVLVIAVTTVVAALRRQWLLVLGVGAMVGAMNLTTQVLKYRVFTRPDLDDPGTFDANTLPSGHTTVAGSVAVAVLLVVPPRWRWLAALVGAGYTGLTGLATMINGWHRASDVVAGVLVVAAWALLAQALAGPGDADGRTRAVMNLLGLVGAGAAVVAGLALVVTRWADADPSRVERLLAYGGASMGVLAVVCLATAAMLLVGTRKARR